MINKFRHLCASIITDDRVARRIEIPLWAALCALLWAVLITQLYHQGVLP